MSWSHIRCFYLFTFIINKTTAIIKNCNVFIIFLSTSKNWTKKIYLTCHISKSIRDFHSIFFSMLWKTVCDDILKRSLQSLENSKLDLFHFQAHCVAVCVIIALLAWSRLHNINCKHRECMCHSCWIHSLGRNLIIFFKIGTEGQMMAHWNAESTRNT